MIQKYPYTNRQMNMLQQFNLVDLQMTMKLKSMQVN